MNLETLRQALTEMEKKSDAEWLASLDQRKIEELRFHDRDRDQKTIDSLNEADYRARYGNKKFYEATTTSKTYMREWIARHTPGKVFLDYACGNGKSALAAAQAGAALAIGLDISRISIENAKQAAREAKVEKNTWFVQGDAENTGLPTSSVDAIVCDGMLHHLDLSHAFPELRRILSPGGRIFAYESLCYNPLIKLYRNLTPEMRTNWEKEHILGLAEVDFARRFFTVADLRYWHIASTLVPFMRPCARGLHAIDAVLTRIPGIRRMAWIFTFEMQSKK